MEYFLSVLFIALGVILVVKGGDWFVDAASWIAKALKIPTFVIGATVVSFATTLPEMLVSCIAAFNAASSGTGDTDMAIGNAVGSVTANTGLIMAISFVFLGAVVVRKEVWPQIAMLIGSALFLFLGSLSGQLEIWSSVVLVFICAGFMAYNVVSGKKHASGVPEEEVKKDGKTVAFKIFLFVIGAAGIVGGSELLVNGATDFATLLGIDDRIIAITIVAVGTSLPELVTTITAIRKKESNLSVGNVIGANIIDLTLILPICSIVSGQPLPVTGNCLMIDMPVCLGVVMLGTLPLLIKEKSYKWQGLTMLAVYIAYIIFSAVLTSGLTV